MKKEKKLKLDQKETKTITFSHTQTRNYVSHWQCQGMLSIQDLNKIN